MAPAGLWTTPSDLARVAIEVQNEYAGKSSKILSQEMMHQMLTRQKDDWGLGFELESPGYTQRFGHGGSNEGFRCDLEAYIGSTQGFVIMTNSDDGDNLATEFLGAVAREYNWPDFQPKERTVAKIDPVILRNYAGIYEAPGLSRITITAEDGKLYLRVSEFGPMPVDLLPESETSFFSQSPGINLPFTFEKDTKGTVSKLIVIVGGQTFEAKKIE
jgi:hypothetical protein